MDAEELAWKDYADACASHDVELGRHALHDMVPAQRAALRNGEAVLAQDAVDGIAG